jgi:hypothetical protein
MGKRHVVPQSRLHVGKFRWTSKPLCCMKPVTCVGIHGAEQSSLLKYITLYRLLNPARIPPRIFCHFAPTATVFIIWERLLGNRSGRGSFCYWP